MYNAPYILGILARYVHQQACCKEHLILITSLISRIAYSPQHRDTVSSNRHVRKIIDAATSEASTLPPQAVFKLKALFAAAGTTVAAHETELKSIGAATAVARWPGGRHKNDHVDFRRIQVVPSVEELKHSSPFLPYADASDKFLVWEVSFCPGLLTGES